LFLSGGPVPRAATGDAAVYWADRLASDGYRSFRFDLPGLGDSDGDLPQTENAFLSLVNAGAFSGVVSGITDYLVARFDLPGIVVIGHCSGATTALYSAAINKRIKGLILLDPSFQVQPDGEIQNALVSWHFRIIRRLVGDGSAASYLRAVRLHTWIRNLYLRGKHIRFLWRRGLPSTANLPLIHCWNQLASAGLRMLVLRSPSFTPKPGEFDYVGHLKPIADPVKLIGGTTHAFAERQGKEAVRKYVEEWLSAYVLPPERVEARDTGIRRPRPGGGY
jgi:pimeloyl-ACP methyl ester carboxylesterase